MKKVAEKEKPTIVQSFLFVEYIFALRYWVLRKRVEYIRMIEPKMMHLTEQ